MLCLEKYFIWEDYPNTTYDLIKRALEDTTTRFLPSQQNHNLYLMRVTEGFGSKSVHWDDWLKKSSNQGVCGAMVDLKGEIPLDFEKFQRQHCPWSICVKA